MELLSGLGSAREFLYVCIHGASLCPVQHLPRPGYNLCSVCSVKALFYKYWKWLGYLGDRFVTAS